MQVHANGMNNEVNGANVGYVKPVLTLDQADTIVPHSFVSGPHVVRQKFEMRNPQGKIIRGYTYSNRGYPCSANCQMNFMVDIVGKGMEDPATGKWSNRFMVVTPPGLSICEVLDGQFYQTHLSGAISSRACEEMLMDAVRVKAAPSDEED